MLIRVRIHGRGGQGVVTAAELLAIAVHQQGLYPQAFPEFGSERMGSPVRSYVRISDQPVRIRTPVEEPDVVIVQDPTLIWAEKVTAGLKPGGLVVVNTELEPGQLGIEGNLRVVTVPATKMALETMGRPIPNTALLGAFGGITGLIGMEAVKGACQHRFAGELASLNIACAQRAYDYVSALARN